MSIYYNNEKTENNEYVQMVDLFYKKPKDKKKVISMCIKKSLPNDKDRAIERCIKNFLTDNTKIINIPLTSAHPFDGELYSYAIQKPNKNEYDCLYLIYYLKFYDTFNNLLIKMYSDEEKTFLFSLLVNKIKIEEKGENSILFKVGELSEKFYFLLNGSTTRIIPYQYEAVMDKHEFFIYMKYIYKIDEIELFNLNLNENEEIFDKYEVLSFILGDKKLKFHADAIKQLRKMEKLYVSKIFDNKLGEINFNNENKIILSQNKKKYDDIVKGDHIISCTEDHLKKLKVPIEQYINNLKPIFFEEENFDLVKKKATLYLYKIDKEIKVGEHLEELENKISKRSSTIICNNDCIFGYFTKKEYYDCIKVTQTKFHRQDINFLLQNELFAMITFPEFDRNYYHLFEISKKNQNQMLFNQGEINNNIYFLKQGEVSVSLEGSITDLYRIIGLKGGPKNRKDLDFNFIKRFYSVNLDDNFLKEIKKLPIFKINENFPIGLDDFLDEENENKHLFNVCCNIESETLEISKQNFEFIIYRENEVKKIKSKYISKRKNLLIEKLNSLKNGLIQKYIIEKYKVKIFLPDIFEEMSFSKRINPERSLNISPKKKNDFSYIDSKLNTKSYKEITTALKSKDNAEPENINNEKSEEEKSEDSSSEINVDNILNNKNESQTIDFENIKTENNENQNMNRPRRRRNIALYTVRLRPKDIKLKEKKGNEEILELLKSQNLNQINEVKNNKKVSLDPLDKIYRNLKNPSMSSNKSLKNIENKNKVYYITSFKVLSPIKPHKFIPKVRKIILPQKQLYGCLNKKMKEIKVLKTISQIKPSVILKTENNLHDIYYDVNNNPVSSLNFYNNKNEKKKINELKFLILNNNKINRSINYKMNRSMDKKSDQTQTSDINSRYGPSVRFPMINSSINIKNNNYNIIKVK